MKSISELCLFFYDWLYVFLMVLLTLFSYYTYIFQLTFLILQNNVERYVYSIFFHIFLIMFIWSYWQTIYTKNSPVPQEFKPAPAEVEILEIEQSEHIREQLLTSITKNLNVLCRNKHGRVRYCKICHNIKPDRAHHCSICQRCIIKFDHHCVFLNNCIGFNNYKFFILCLSYGLLYSFWIISTSFRFLWQHNVVGSVQFTIPILFSGCIILSVISLIILTMHIKMIFLNRTTIEQLRPPLFETGPDKDGFNLGKYANFLEIFGEDMKKWFLPIFTSLGNGVSFPIHMRVGSFDDSTRSSNQENNAVFPSIT